MNLIFSIVLAASASAASKDYLANDPMLAGSVIKYCEHDAPKSCKTIDRRNETMTHDLASISGQLALKLSKIAPEFHTVTVDFVESEKAPGSLDMQFKFTQDPKKVGRAKSE